jgi:hypothetical protein
VAMRALRSVMPFAHLLAHAAGGGRGVLAGRALDVGGVEGEGLEAAAAVEAGAQDPGEAGDGVGVLEQEVAEGVGDGAAAVALDALEDVRVVADDEVGAGVDEGLRGLALVGAGSSAYSSPQWTKTMMRSCSGAGGGDDGGEGRRSSVVTRKGSSGVPAKCGALRRAVTRGSRRFQPRARRVSTRNTGGSVRAAPSGMMPSSRQDDGRVEHARRRAGRRRGCWRG